MSLAKNVEFLRHFPKLNGFNGLGIYGRPASPSGRSPLVEISGFGTDPGALKMFAYVPEPLPRAPALVVVLHGCGQTAAAYDFGTGWSTLAKRYGLCVAEPANSRRSNNANTCFTGSIRVMSCAAAVSRFDPADGPRNGRRYTRSIPAASISPGFPPAAR